MSNNGNPEYNVANPIPLLSEDLIKELDKFYPTKAALPGTSFDKLWFDNGRRNLIDQLLERLGGTNLAQQQGDITIDV